MTGVVRWMKARLRKTLRPPLHAVTTRRSFVFLGTEYGGWPLLNDTTPGTLIYSFGVGEDISFDLGTINRFSCKVYAFDPTPKSVHWVIRQALPPEFKFHPIGVAASDGEAEFAPPAQEAHLSFSSTKAATTPIKNAVKAPVKRISTLIDELGTGQPSVIKMDIEGFEYEVIADMLASGICPRQFLVEFHHDLYGFSKDDTRQSVAMLESAGYELFYIAPSGREYGFARNT